MTFFETQTLEVAVLDGLLQISGAQSRESRESGAERAASYQRWNVRGSSSGRPASYQRWDVKRPRDQFSWRIENMNILLRNSRRQPGRHADEVIESWSSGSAPPALGLHAAKWQGHERPEAHDGRKLDEPQATTTTSTTTTTDCHTTRRLRWQRGSQDH